MSVNNGLPLLRAALAPLGVALAAAFAPSLAHADAVAQSYLDIANFHFGITGTTPTITGGTDNGDVSASLNGTTLTDSANPGLYTGFTLTKTVGPQAGSYTPGTAIMGSPTGTYVGSYAFIDNGDPVAATAHAVVDNTVSLQPTGIGSAQSNTSLLVGYMLTAGQSFTLDVSFDAKAFLRALLDPAGVNGSSANASYDWNISISKVGSGKVFSWSPDGNVGSGITGGTETADAFDLSEGISALPFFSEDMIDNSAGGHFEATSNLFTAGNYQITISHKSAADAQMIPEPTVLSLMGVALLGLGWTSRRRASRK